MWGLGKSVASRDGALLIAETSPDGWKGVVDKVVKWVPGDILALYAAGVVAFDSDTPRWWLVAAAVVAAPLFLRLGAFATGGAWGKKEQTAAALAMPATALWTGSVPGNGWLEWDWIAENQKPAAWVFLVAAGVFSLVADGLVRRTS